MSIHRLTQLAQLIQNSLNELKRELALHDGTQIFDVEKLRTYNYTHGVPERHGFPWTNHEDLTLISRFQRGTPIDTIAHRHKRTPIAIRKRLVLLGLLKEEYPFSVKRSQAERIKPAAVETDYDIPF